MGTKSEPEFFPGDYVRLRNGSKRRLGIVLSDSPEQPHGASNGELGYFVLFGDNLKTWVRGRELILVFPCWVFVNSRYSPTS